MKKSKLKVIVVVLGILVISFMSISYADVGNINRYDSDSSYSSSNDYSYSSSSRNNSSSSSSGGFGGTISTVVVILIIVFVVGKSSGKIKNIKDLTDINKVKDVLNDLENLANTNTGVGADNFEQKMKETDPNFSREKFMSFANDVFVKIQQAWTKRDWKVIRPFESNELFEQHSTQLQEYIDNNKINVMERISIVDSDIGDYRLEGDKEIIEVWIGATLRDYIIDATTKEVLEGDPNKDYDMTYFLTFYRKNGTKTKEDTSNMSTTNCPNCGAPTQITSAGQCEYCDSVITTGDHDWVLSKIEGEPAE